MARFNTFDAYDGSGGGLAQRRPLILRELCERGARYQPDEEIWTRIDDGYHKETWRVHQQKSYRLASALHKFGIKHADRVATFEFNTARHMQLYHAVPCMGAVLHPLNIRLHAEELAYIIDDAQDRVIFVGAKLLPMIEAVEAKFPAKFASVKLVVVMGHNEEPGHWTSSLRVPTVDYEAFIARGDSFFAYPDFDENSAAALCYTSGTTGRPKGVLYSHRSTYLHTMMLFAADAFGLRSIDCLLPVVPLFHVLSWGWPYAAMAMGMRYCLFNSFAASGDILKFLIDAEVTKSAGVPTIWQEVREELTRHPHKYTGKLKLQEVVSGGSAPPSELMVWYGREWNVNFIQAWGMTETNPIGTVSRTLGKRKHLEQTPEERAQNVRKTGLPVPGVQMKVVDPDDFDKELPHDGKSSGELLVKGPWICGSYFKNRGQKSFHKGWLATGDIATIDEEGYMVIRDRSKDLIKSGGEWISSQDMENMTTALPNVLKACVVGMPHPKWTERPVVIVVLDHNENEKELLKKIRMHLSSKFAKFQLPDDVLVWHEIPETSTRKMDKKTVRKKLKEEGYVLPSLRKSKL